MAVVRLRSLGDCVLTTPALEILRGCRPDLRIAVVVEERFVPVFEGNPDIDDLLPPSGGTLAAWRPRLCLNLHGGARSAMLTLRSRAPLRAGFAHYRYSFLYNVRIPRAQRILGVERTVHTAEHLASAIFHLGAPRVEIPRAKLARPAGDPARNRVVLHPVASSPGKTWPAAGFAAIAARLKSEWGLDPVFIGGAGDDLSAFSAYRTLAGAPLAEVKSLLYGAALFVGNDSGPAHMAAAYGVPSLVIFGDSDAAVWRPWKTASRAIVAGADIQAVTPAEVWTELESLRSAA